MTVFKKTLPPPIFCPAAPFFYEPILVYLIPLLHFKLALYVFEEKQSASTVYSKMCDDATQNIKILDLEKV